MLEKLKKEVLMANLSLPKFGLVKFTWGNVSGIDRENGLVVIKASGIKYEDMEVKHMIVVDMSGNIIEGDYRYSSDTPTHIALYRHWKGIAGIVHTHSTYATAFAQAGVGIPCYGTTHADYFYGEVPCTRAMTEEEVAGDYEENTAKPILDCFEGEGYIKVPAVIVRNHGVFTWGKDANEAVHNSVVLEEVARMAAIGKVLNTDMHEASEYLQKKHYLRKHGEGAYYGQN
jgi:L-ribulose-5-phosphate 4-epimerase